MTNQDNYCVIMGGGIGSRFWPFSRKTLPKQFLDFFGTGRSLLQQTFDRFQKVIPTENIFIVTNAMYADLVKEQLPEVNEEQILLEPARRNTAPCIAWAAYHIRALNPNANIVVAPSDHLILKEDEFLAAIEKGLDFVSRSEKLLTLGIKPNRPETGYGYIQIDEPAGGNFYKVKTFTEKPELELAKVFVESGEFYWNSGLFMWNVNTITKATTQLMRDLGSIPSPENCFLLNLGLETLPLRVERHCENAQKVAEFLDAHEKVSHVIYAGLPNDKYHELAQKYMDKGRTCGVISFELTGGRDAAVRFMDGLKLANIATHVAASKTMVLHPASHTHRQMNDEQLREAGVSPGMIRLSVGIESAKDIINDLKEALENA